MQLSVIVPTVNEAENIGRTLAALPGGAEIIVSDGESEDATTAIASSLGASVVSGPRGRGQQMNRGAKTAGGDVLLFVHADCALSPEAAPAIARALESPRVVGGSFRLSVRGARPALRLVTFGSNLRARYLKTPYGDQGLFVRREAFEAVGGFADVPLMEDVGIVRKLRRRGRLVALDVDIETSARHWERLGPLRTTLVNWTLIALYFAGVAPHKLAPLYRRIHESSDGGAPERALARAE